MRPRMPTCASIVLRNRHPALSGDEPMAGAMPPNRVLT